jgi:hypothetical protein
VQNWIVKKMIKQVILSGNLKLMVVFSRHLVFDARLKLWGCITVGSVESKELEPTAVQRLCALWGRK